MMAPIRTLAICCALLGMAACVVRAPSMTTVNAPVMVDSDPPAPYLLGTGDVIDVKLYYNPELSETRFDVPAPVSSSVESESSLCETGIVIFLRHPGTLPAAAPSCRFVTSSPAQTKSSRYQTPSSADARGRDRR